MNIVKPHFTVYARYGSVHVGYVIKLKLVSCRYPVIERPQIVLSVENALVILDAS